MKKIHLLITVFIAFLLINAYAAYAPHLLNKGVTIIKANNEADVTAIKKRYSKNNFRKVKNREVKVFCFAGDSGHIFYHIAYYLNCTGKMNCFGATLQNNNLFDEATVNWINDTLVAVSLKDTKSGDTKLFRLFGNIHYKNDMPTKISGIIE